MTRERPKIDRIACRIQKLALTSTGLGGVAYHGTGQLDGDLRRLSVAAAGGSYCR